MVDNKSKSNLVVLNPKIEMVNLRKWVVVGLQVGAEVLLKVIRLGQVLLKTEAHLKVVYLGQVLRLTEVPCKVKLLWEEVLRLAEVPCQVKLLWEVLRLAEVQCQVKLLWEVLHLIEAHLKVIYLGPVNLKVNGRWAMPHPKKKRRNIRKFLKNKSLSQQPKDLL